jgi:hypothetical protein
MATTTTSPPTTTPPDSELTFISHEKIVPTNITTAFELFREHVWLKSLGPDSWTTIVEKGDEKTRIGETRQVPLGLRERISACDPPHSFEYSVVAGPFPVDYHLGRVEFKEFVAEDGSKLTKVTWSVKFKPKPGMGLGVSATVNGTFPMFLGNYASAVAKHNEMNKKS